MNPFGLTTHITRRSTSVGASHARAEAGRRRSQDWAGKCYGACAALFVLGVLWVGVVAAQEEGAPCDDDRRCTTDDRIVDGVCTGTAYSCHDGLDCTNDLCDGAGGCRHFIASGYCLIDERCYERDARASENACRVCDPSFSNVQWHEPSGRPCLGGVCRDGGCVVSLNVQRRGTGSGVILGKRMLCDRECSFELPAGTKVRLTAEAARGSRFDGWAGACTGAGECLIEMSVGASVVANFVRKTPAAPPVQLIVEKVGDGVVTSFPSGVDCGEHCWHTFTHGTTVTLYATPIKGMEFKGWRGGCRGNSRECSVELRAAQMVSAEFGEPRRRRFGARLESHEGVEARPVPASAIDDGDQDDLVGPPAP